MMVLEVPQRYPALAGLLAGIAAIAVGCIFLIFTLPFIGRPGKVCGKGCVQEDQDHPLGFGGRAEGGSAAARWNGRGHRRSRDCPGTGTGRFKIIDYSKPAWTIEDLSRLSHLRRPSEGSKPGLFHIQNCPKVRRRIIVFFPGMLFILPAAKHME